MPPSSSDASRARTRRARRDRRGRSSTSVNRVRARGTARAPTRARRSGARRCRRSRPVRRIRLRAPAPMPADAPVTSTCLPFRSYVTTREASLGRHAAHARVSAAHGPGRGRHRRGAGDRGGDRGRVRRGSVPTSRCATGTPTGLARTAAAVEAAGSHVRTAMLDVRDGDAVRGLGRRPLDRVDVLVNNAGGGFFAAFLDVNDKGQDALIRENFTSVTNFIRAVRPADARRPAARSSTSRRSRRTVPRPASPCTRR